MQIYQTRGGDIPLPPARENKNVSKKKAAKTAASRKHRKKGLAELLVTGAILITAAAIAASLFFYFRPFTPQDVVNAGKHLAASVSGHITEGLDILWEQGIGRLFSRTDAPSSVSLAEGSPRSPGGEKDQDTGNIVPFLDHTTDLGQASDFSAEPVYRAKEDSIFTFMLDTALGPMLYYSQGDIRWKDYLYGGQDPISSYGCGPVCVAMIINSFSPTGIDPIGMADWSQPDSGQPVGFRPAGGKCHGPVRGACIRASSHQSHSGGPDGPGKPDPERSFHHHCPALCQRECLHRRPGQLRELHKGMGAAAVDG